ncbi:MAG: dihydrofolate reductase family protein [Candidatus Dormibacteraeota bacterium]|nr:dihydrofolate reductase family protein [Candidatus Dormibacteraeota bacterium]
MKLTVQTFLTLDGVMQAPGGPDEDPGDGFTHGGWQAPFPDPAVGAFVTELNSHASAFLLGRKTFDIFRGYWPDQTDPANAIATAINSLPKYVVSKSLSETDATWRGEHPDTARLVTGDVVAAVRRLKSESGDELQIWGSGKLLDTLLQHELVDRFRLMTFPLVLGSGRRLFNAGTAPATMRAVDLTTTEMGVVIGTYEPAGPVRVGHM